MILKEIKEKFGNKKLIFIWATYQSNDVYFITEGKPQLLVFYRMKELKSVGNDMGTINEIAEEYGINPYEVWINNGGLDCDCVYYKPTLSERIRTKIHKIKGGVTLEDLANRMKEFYENITRYHLLRRTYTIIRIDGKAFHTYTRGLEKPFDEQLMNDFDETAKYLCEEIQGAKFAYLQSDEISILLTDFDKLTTSAWFDNNLQKMVSVSASMATAHFNSIREGKLALFDSRVFQIPTSTEVENYFIWRQKDAIRNSIQSVAQSLYSQKQLLGKNSNELQEMIFQKGTNWNDYSPKYKRGRIIMKSENGFKIIEAPDFLGERENLKALIPINL
jgi:tRNA(His) guanylyltransferase